jgi:large subunit ribosomal protein L15
MQLHDVHQGVNKRKLRKRVGRGPGSGHGKTSSKGHKGHSSRQGFKQAPLMEGGSAASTTVPSGRTTRR